MLEHVYQELKALAMEHDLVFVLPKAPPCAPPTPPKNGIVIVDYLDILAPARGARE